MPSEMRERPGFVLEPPERHGVEPPVDRRLAFGVLA